MVRRARGVWRAWVADVRSERERTRQGGEKCHVDAARVGGRGEQEPLARAAGAPRGVRRDARAQDVHKCAPHTSLLLSLSTHNALLSI